MLKIKNSCNTRIEDINCAFYLTMEILLINKKYNFRIDYLQ